MPAPYSAGSIWLQIVPSFKGGEDEIRREAREYGDKVADDFGKGFDDRVSKDMPKAVEKAGKESSKEAEKAGDDAGKRYAGRFATAVKSAVASTQRELKALKIPVDDKEAIAKVAGLQSQLKSISKAKIGVNMDAADALATIKSVENSIRDLKDSTENIDLRVNFESAAQGIKKVHKELETLSDTEVEIQVEVKVDERKLNAFEQKIKEAVRGASENLPAVEITADSNDVDRAINDVREDLERLNDQTIGIDIDAGSAFIALGFIEETLRGISDESIDIDTRFNAAKLAGQVASARAEIMTLSGIEIEPEIKLDRQLGKFERTLKSAVASALEDLPPVDLDADSTEVDRAIARIRAELFELGDKRIGIDIDDSEAFLRIGALQAELTEISMGKYGIDIGVNTSSAAAALSSVYAAVEKLDGRDVDIDVDVDGAAAAEAQLANIERAIARSSTEADDGANSFRAFNGRILLAAAGGGALIPILGAVVGGIGALGPLLAVGGVAAGVFALGLFGIGDALQAMGDASKNATKDQQAYDKAVRTATNSVVAAQRDLADAREDAGRSAERANQRVLDSLQRVEDAEEGVRDAIADREDAQRSLQQAIRDVIEEQEDLALRNRNAKLDERKATLELREAEAALLEGRRNGASGDELEELLLAYDKAQYDIDKAVEAQGDFTAAQAEFARSGVEGSEKVIDARQRVADAEARVAQAQRAVADAQAQVAQARLEQERAAADSQRAIEDAQLRLTEAQIDYNEAISQTSASQDKVAESMRGLGPAARGFVDYLFSLRDFVKEMRFVAQEGLIPGLQTWMQTIIGTYGPQIISIISVMSQAIGDMFLKFATSLEGEPFQKLFDMIERSGPVFLGVMGDILVKLGEGIASLIVALEPLSMLFGEWILQGATAFAEWAAALEGSEGLMQFLDYVERVGPKVGDFFSALGGALLNLGIALAPFGEVLLEGITGFLRFIGDMDPEQLAAIVIGIAALTAAFQTLVGLKSLITGFSVVMNILNGALVFMGLTAAPTAAAGAATVSATLGGVVLAIGAVIVALALIGVGLYLLWTQSETFRNIVTAVWDAVVAGATFLADWFMGNIWPRLQEFWNLVEMAAVFLWEQVLKPIFDVWGVVFGVLVELLKKLWQEVGQPLFALIGDIISTLWKNVVEPIFNLIMLLFGALVNFIMAAWNSIGKPIFDAFIAIVSFLWEKIISPVFGFIIEAFGRLVGFFQSTWDTLLKPVFEAFGAIVNGLIEVFQGSFDGIKSIWNALVGLFLAPVRFVVETVINRGIIGGINWLAEKFGAGKDWIRPVPTDWIAEAQEFASFATGGAIGGQSPSKKSDNVPIWATAGEFMQPVDSVDYYGMDVMEAMRKRLIPREMFQMRAEGGPIYQQLFNTIKAKFPRANLNSSVRRGDPGYHGSGRAVDLGEQGFAGGAGRPYLAAMARWIYENFPNSTELIYTGLGDSTADLKNGRILNYGRATNEAHRNHVHWAMATADMITSRGGAAPGGLPRAGNLNPEETGPWGKIMNFITNPIGFLKDMVTNAAGDIAQNPIGAMLLNIPNKIADLAKDKLVEIMGFFQNLFDGDGAPGTEDAPAGKPSANRSLVQALASERGWGTGAEWTALDKLVNKESGYNNKAQNPTSTAYGMFQFLNGTWAGTGFKKTSDPTEQTLAGLNYIGQRYGTPVKAWAFHQKNNHYSEGGRIEDSTAIVPELHDQGGKIWPGLNVIMNRTRKPEASLNPEQLANIRAIADGGGTAPLIGELNLPIQSNATPESIAGEIMHSVKVARRGGAHP